MNDLVLQKKHQLTLAFFNIRNSKKLICEKTKNVNISFNPIFRKQFVRNSYFFLYFLQKSKIWVNNFQNKIKHFRIGYTFVNITYLKKYIVRRFSREMFFSKFGLSLGSITVANYFFYKNPKQFFSKNQISAKHPVFLWFDNYQTFIRTLPESKTTPLRYITRIRFKPGYSRQ